MTKNMRRVLLSIVLLPIAILTLSNLPYRMFGVLNRRFRWFDTFFFVYPASAAYARNYAPAWFEDVARWVPCPIGIMQCGGSRGVVFGSLMTERDFLAPRNAENFSRLMRRMEKVAKLAGLPSIRMAGILPSTAARRGESFFEDTSHVAAQVVFKAFAEIRERQQGGNQHTVAILLGGAGLVGAQVASMMKDAGIPHRVLDPRSGPIDLSVFRGNAPMVLIDIARKGVLEQYLPHLPDGIVILNETYPEPGKKVRRQLAERGSTLFHIRGVQGSVWPQLPGGYANAIPCCGAPTDGRDVEVQLSQLVPEQYDLPMAA
ncbi:MAG: hypothetical protein AAF415_01335 [Pseudomonadota bacterium]